MFDSVIKKPKITVLFLILFMVIGFITFWQLPQREIPEISLDIATVTTVYPGATPEMVERTITVPIEEAIERIAGIQDFSSVSSLGASNIVIEIDGKADKDKVLSDIRQTIIDTSRGFPEQVLSPNVNETIQLGALSSYHILSEDREGLYRLGPILSKWQQEIESIPGVKNTVVKGVPEEEIIISLDSERMAELGILVPDVLQAYSGEFGQVPIGTKQIGDRIHQLALPQMSDISQVAELPVGLNDGEPIYIDDIGDVSLQYKEMKDVISYEGIPTLSFTVVPERGIDVPSLHKAVDEKLNILKEDLSTTATLDLYYTQNNIVSEIFRDLSLSFIISVIVVIFVTLLGLNFSSALIVALAIPISILLGLVPLPYVGVDLNQISIIGFIIALGILVDDAIVVNDNIQRRYKLGDSALEGAIKGTKEVRVSIITSTLAVVFTFLPLVFISGSGGDFIRAMPTVLITTIIASTILSLTLVPIYRVWREKKRKESKKERKDGLLGKSLDSLANWYANKVLANIVKKPLRVGLIGLLFCTVVYGLVPFIPVVFFPSADREEVTLEVVAPIGTTIEQTDELLRKIEMDIRKQDENVYETAIYTGTGVPGLFNSSIEGAGENTGQIVLRVNKESQSAEETIARWSETLRETYPNVETKLTTIEAGPPVGAPIAIKVTGLELDELTSIVDRLKSDIEQFEGSGAVVDNVGNPWPTILYEPDRDVLAEYGITMKEISEQIALKTEGVPIGSFDDGTEFRDIRLVVDGLSEGEELDLTSLALPNKWSVTEPGPPDLLTFDQFVEPIEVEQIQRVPHSNGERTITVRVYPNEETKSVLEQQITGKVNEYSLDEGYSISIGGETEARTDFFIEVGKLFIVVVFLIFIVMAVQFYSLKTPILVMSTVYLAISGAVIGLFVTQTGLGFMAMMGLVSLAGIVVRNSIVLIEFIEQRLSEGMELATSVIESGRARLRPILLTAFTAIGALVPIALSGDVLFTPLAISIISGIFFSTFFTLLLVPAFYMVMKKKRES
ncbi:efflux RND transporter permease subunit [Bacillus alkalicellulosilyticus]|uniref:efflux RND transporter permease subunit n=1 Tax=Alkalihalobacterium alkalicellulosilyticum TaxID=1912214 RepID=UPI000998026E|nr:efflux RND transporter permease subunit [Bacillus alkalicellulosilyticus]